LKHLGHPSELVRRIRAVGVQHRLETLRGNSFDSPADVIRQPNRDVEGTLEQSIASLTYALEFVRTQDTRDEKVRMLRPRFTEQGSDSQHTQGGETAMLG
jgi:hypothetical protein